MAFGGFFNGLNLPGGHFGRRPSTLARELIHAYGDDPNTSIPQTVRAPAGVTAPGAQLPMPNQGPLPVPAQRPMPMEQMGGIAGGILKASGLDTSQLPYEQQQAVAKQLMMQAGLAMMKQAYNPQGWNNSIGAGLTAGLGAVQGQGEGISAKMTRRALMDRLEKIEGNDVAALQQLAMDALRAGDTEIAQKAGYLIQTLQQGQRSSTQSGARPQQGGTAIGADGKEYKTIFDPTANGGQGGYVMTDIVANDPTSEQGRTRGLQRAKFATAGEDGEVEVIQGSYDPTTGEYFDAQGNAVGNVVAAPNSGGNPTEGELKAAGYLVMMPRHLETLNLAGAPGLFENAILEDGSLRPFNSEELKLMDIAGKAITEIHLRLTTGAAFNDLEYQNAKDLYIPQPGDTQAILDYKAANRRELAAMAQQRAGRAAPEQPAAAASGSNPNVPTGQKTRPVPTRGG